MKDAADFFVTAYDRIQLAIEGALVKMDAVFLQGVVLVLCVLVTHFTAAAKFLDSSFKTIERCTLVFQYLSSFAGSFHDPQ